VNKQVQGKGQIERK